MIKTKLKPVASFVNIFGVFQRHNTLRLKVNWCQAVSICIVDISFDLYAVIDKRYLAFKNR